MFWPSQAIVQSKQCDMTIDPSLVSSSTPKYLTRRKAWTCSRTSYISSRSISELSSVAGERLFEERHLSKLDTVDISPEWRYNGPFEGPPCCVRKHLIPPQAVLWEPDLRFGFLLRHRSRRISDLSF